MSAHAATLSIIEYPTSAQSAPSGITTAPDGNVWFTEEQANSIGRLTPGGTLSEFPVPTAAANLGGIVAGPDGNVWFTEYKGNNVGRITLSGTISEFPVTAKSGLGGIAVGSDGNLWFAETGRNRIGRMSVGGVLLGEFLIPTSGAWPHGLTLGPDGNIWFTELLGNKVARITPKGAITEFALPQASSRPDTVTTGPDGNLWFTENAADLIGRISTNGTLAQFAVPTAAAHPVGITGGPDGNVWFTEQSGDNVGEITPSGLITEFPVPTPAAGPDKITAAPGQTLWFTEHAASKVGTFGLAAAPVDLVAPSLSGAAILGQTLSVSPGVWTGAPAPSFAYQWQSCDANGVNCVPVPGATAPTYTLATADVGTTLAVTVTATNANGVTAATTVPSAVVSAGTPPVDVVGPTLTGTAIVGQTLTVTTGNWIGFPAPTFAYQWYGCDATGANCVPLSGATTSSYTLGGSDLGSTVAATVTATNVNGSSAASTAPSAVVSGGTPPANTTAPALTGMAIAGQTLTVTPGSWSGSPAPTLSYQWLRCDATGANCAAVVGAVSSGYAITAGDVGSTLEATVTATNTSGSAAATTAPTAPVVGVTGPVSPVLDDFNRANGTVSPNWTNIRPTTGFAAMKVSANGAVDASATSFAWNYWNPASFGPDCEAYLTVRAYGASDTIRVGARVTPGSANSGYYVSVSSTGSWTIIRIDGGHAPVTLTTATAPQSIASGDKIAITIVGSVVTALHWTPVGGWAQVLSYDTAADSIRYTAPGFVALEFRTSTIDDLGGGTLP